MMKGDMRVRSVKGENWVIAIVHSNAIHGTSDFDWSFKYLHANNNLVELCGDSKN